MANTLAQPIRRYSWPVYPTKLEVQSRPELLARHQPAGWLSNAELGVAAGLFLAANVSGCSTPASQTTTKSLLAANPPAIVAPLFQHGAGRGATGCVVSNPPAFLSEAEALQVISEELLRSALTVHACGSALPGVSVPLRVPVWEYEWVSGTYDEQIVESKDTTVLVPDLECQSGSIVIEYFSGEDYRAWAGPRNYWSVADYNLPEAASIAGAHVRQQAKGIYFASLYDPLSRLDRDYARQYEERRAAACEESKELLRQQVRDLVDWLKAQGAI